MVVGLLRYRLRTEARVRTRRRLYRNGRRSSNRQSPGRNCLGRPRASMTSMSHAAYALDDVVRKRGTSTDSRYDAEVLLRPTFSLVS